jgi:hypothetical protein
LFSIEDREWSQLALYGLHPCSRWAHVIVPSRSIQPNGFILFGGVNLTSYCKVKAFKFTIANFKDSTIPKSEAQENNLSDRSANSSQKTRRDAFKPFKFNAKDFEIEPEN